MAEEVWKEIDEFPDYAVSSHGYIVNMKYGRDLKPVKTKEGYLKITLRKEGQSFQRYVHQLVAEAFFGDWRLGVRVTFNDQDRSNCNVENLRVMGKESMPPIVYKSPKLTARRLRIVETGQVFRTAYDCANFIGGSATNIYRVLNGHRGSHRGYTFEYVDTKVEQ